MFNDMSTIEIVKLLFPLILFQFGLALFCLIQVWRKGVRNLNKWIWTLIVLCLSLIGPVSYLIFGRKQYGHDND